MSIGQLIELRNIVEKNFLKNHTQSVVKKLVPDLFTKKQN